MTVHAWQFIYTNVEEGLSPKRRRGMQVWLVSPDLPQEYRSEAELLLASFDKPPGSDPNLERFLFAPLSGSNPRMDAAPAFLVARCRALAKPDRFGRGGRYHGHALIFSHTEFRKIGNNPFRVFHSNFSFQDDPDTVDREQIPGFSQGEIASLDRDFPETPDINCPEEFGESLVDLMRIVICRNPTPLLAFPVLPNIVKQLMASLHHRLPPPCRTEATFDTLWSGKRAPAVRFAGAYSPKNIANWSYRNLLRMEPNKPTPPTLAETVRSLTAWKNHLIEVWAKGLPAGDADRESSNQLADWLFQESPKFPPPNATTAAVETLHAVPETSETWKKLAHHELSRRVPADCQTLFQIPAIYQKFFNETCSWNTESLRSFQEPLALVRGNTTLITFFESLKETPTQAVIDALECWLARVVHTNPSDHHSTVLLQGILYRWTPGCLPQLLELLKNPIIAKQLSNYCRATLPSEYFGEPGSSQVLEQLLNALTNSPIWETSSLYYSLEKLEKGAKNDDVRSEDSSQSAVERIGLLLAMKGAPDTDPQIALTLDMNAHSKWIVERYLPTLASRMTRFITYNMQTPDRNILEQSMPPTDIDCSKVVSLFAGYRLSKAEFSRPRILLRRLFKEQQFSNKYIAKVLLSSLFSKHNRTYDLDDVREKKLRGVLEGRYNWSAKELKDYLTQCTGKCIEWFISQLKSDFPGKLRIETLSDGSLRVGCEIPLSQLDTSQRNLLCYLTERAHKNSGLFEHLMTSLFESTHETTQFN